MRKIIALLLVAALALCCASALGEEVYASNFDSGADGWYGRGAVSYAVGGVLRTEGRQSDWHSPGRNFDLVEGGKYELSVEVRQDQVDSATFMISVAHSLDGAESYENLARGTAKKGEWTTLTGSYTAGHFQQFVLYVETTGAPTLVYDIRNFTVTAPQGVPQAQPTEAPMVIEAADDLPSLKEIYAGLFDFGAAVPQHIVRNKTMMNFALRQFNIMTPENELKPDAVLDVAASKRLAQEDETAVAVHFDAARPLLDFAKANGVKIHGHVLVWHSQTPAAFFREGYDANKPFVSREVMLARLENYIRQVMAYLDENYPGVVVSWDVVNEAVDDGAGNLRPSPWLNTVGQDYLLRAFELARKYAPQGTLLYYNDYNTAMPNKLRGIVRVLEGLMAEGNIDGYGFQMHHSVGSPSMSQITTAVETVAALGLKLRVSELDIGVDGNSETSFEKQAVKYAQIMQLLRRFSDQVEAVQVWGITDNMSWRSANYPLLFDASCNPKPAFYAVAEPDKYAE